VESNSPGISIGRIEDKCNFRGSNTAEVILGDVRVPQENFLGKEGQGFAIAMSDFDMSRPAARQQKPLSAMMNPYRPARMIT